MQGNRPRASKLKASGVRAVQEQCAGDATKRGGPAGGYAGVPAVFQQHTRVSRGSSTREQENPEVRGGVGLANQSGSIVLSHKPMTSSSSYLSSIIRARPQHLKKAREPSYRASSDPFAEISLPWQSQPPSPRITVRNIPPAILHPLQPFPASFFVTHGTSSLSSTSRHQFCSSREFTFRPFSFTTKATPRFALTH
jgi:hypothetical protein